MAGRMRWSGRVALVTGASAGIGFAVTGQLAKLGMVVIGCARNIENIQILGEELKESDVSGSVHAIKCDVSKEDEILSMFSGIKKQFGGVDICVNNAGMLRPCTLLDGDTDGWREMLDVNILGLSVCTREAIKSMRERNVDDGHVFHLNSLSGHRVYPFPAGHFCMATKYAVTALTEGLRLELREIKSHIRITCVSPGFVNTEFPYRSLGREKGEQVLSQHLNLEANDIADAIVFALQAPPHVQIHDILMRSTEQPS